MNSFLELPHWKECVTAFLRDGYAAGAEIPHAWFYDHLRIAKPTATMPHRQAEDLELAYLRDMDRVKEALLRDHNIALQPKRGFGYRVVPPGEQAAWADREMVRGIRKEMSRGISRIVHVDTALLTDGEAKERSDLLAKGAMLQSMMKKGLKKASRLKP